MSGVVSPVVTCSSLVVTPSVPMLADGCPAIRQSWRVSSTVEVLPLVPVTATMVFGKRREELRREPGEFAARLVGGDVDRALDLRLAAGRRPRPRRRATASAMKSSPLKRAPAKGAEHRAGRDLAMIDGEAGDALLARHRRSAPPRRISRSAAPATSGLSADVSMSRLASGMTPSSGPTREITRLTTGAAVQAAVVWP